MEFIRWEHDRLSLIWDAAGKPISVLKIRRWLAASSVCVCLSVSFPSPSLSFCVSAVRGKSQFYCHYLWNCIPRRWMLSLTFMTSREAQSPPKLFNMDAVEADTYTHIHNTQTQACTQKHMGINVLLHTCKHLHVHTFRVFFVCFFAPKTMHGWCFAPADDDEW